MAKLPLPSKLFELTPRKSRTLGSAIVTRRSRNSNMRRPRSVTRAPTGMPSLSLKFDTDREARVTTAFCPAINVSSPGGRLRLPRILYGIAHAHVEDDLVQSRDGVDVPVTERLHHRRTDGVVVHRLETRHGHGVALRHPSITSPERLATRTLRPSSRVRNPTRVGRPSTGSATARFERSIASSLVMMPPGSRAVGLV